MCWCFFLPIFFVFSFMLVPALFSLLSQSLCASQFLCLIFCSRICSSLFSVICSRLMMIDITCLRSVHFRVYKLNRLLKRVVLKITLDRWIFSSYAMVCAFCMSVIWHHNKMNLWTLNVGEMKWQTRRNKSQRKLSNFWKRMPLAFSLALFVYISFLISNSL